MKSRVDIGHVVAAAHSGVGRPELTAQGADEVAAGERGVSQRENFVSFFGQLLGKAAAEITFANPFGPWSKPFASMSQSCCKRRVSSSKLG